MYTVAKLAAYVDPLSNERVCSLLRIDELTWATIRTRLVDAGFLVGSPRPWFHELRRRAIWNGLLDDDMRALAVQAATTELSMQLELTPGDTEIVVEYSRVAAKNSELQRENPQVGLAVRLNSQELAVAAAALELVEPAADGGPGAIDSGTLLAFARDQYGLGSEPLEALEGLAKSGLAYVASNERASVLLPTWGSREAVAVVVGRSASELGRVPTARLATAAFEAVLRPRMRGFEMAQFGVGSPSFAELSRMVVKAHRRPKDGVVHLGADGPGVAIRARHGDVPLYLAAAFPTGTARDEAVSKLSGLEEDLWEQELVVDDVVPLPQAKVPSLRFLAALKWLDDSAVNLFMLSSPNLAQPVSIEEELDSRLRLRQLVKKRSSAIERLAYGVEISTGYAFAIEDGSASIVEVGGWDSVVERRRGRDAGSLGHDAFWSLRLREELGLRVGHSIRRQTWRAQAATTKDPLCEELLGLQKSAAEFNSSQSGFVLDLDEKRIRRLLEASFRRRRLDGLALLEEFAGSGLREPAPTQTCVFLDVHSEGGRWSGGPEVTAYTRTLPCDPSEVAVRFKMEVDRGGPRGERLPEESMEAAFGISKSNARQPGIDGGDGDSVISELLGFRRDEMRLNLRSLI